MNKNDQHEKPIKAEVKLNDIPVPKEFNIKKARYEVIRFGMTGFDKEKQVNSKIAMAIKLGAKVSYIFIFNLKWLL